MGEAAELEEVQVKLENLAHSGPGCDYFAFDVETGTRIKIGVPRDPI